MKGVAQETVAALTVEAETLILQRETNALQKKRRSTSTAAIQTVNNRSDTKGHYQKEKTVMIILVTIIRSLTGQLKEYYFAPYKTQKIVI